MSSGANTYDQSGFPLVLIHAARLVAVCSLVLQISIAGIAGTHAVALQGAPALCLKDTAVDPTPAQPTPPAPFSHHHDGDCCFLNFGELTPGVIAIIATYLTPPLASRSKPSAHLFIHLFHSSPELSPLAPRAPPVARV
jgi:hypothetical protein